MMLNKIKYNWELLLLIAIHAVILFYNYTGIPFYHDELSAIERCRFNDLTTLIEKGVMVDGHPAGVHLFLFGLIQLFGIHEWILKLPFVLAGIGSLIFLYKISEFIFSKYAAITTCIFFIFLSYYIAQIIVVRPYSPGLFFTLGAFYYGLTIKLSPFKKYRYIMLSLFSVGAMYAHYFSFLQCVLVWIILFAYNANKMNVRYYLIATGASVAAFLPHASITFSHLEMGGLEWLGVPDYHFFTTFFYTYFNSSRLLLIVATVLFILSFMVNKPRKKNKITLLLLFILPCIILYYYSVSYAPVLQAPALYFCTPFLLLFLGNGVDYIKNIYKPAFIILLLLFSFYLLVFHNKYYQLRDYQPIEKFVTSSKTFAAGRPASKILYIWAGNSNYIGHYLNKHDFKQRVISTDTLKNIRNIDISQYDAIVCTQLSPQILFELNKTFPFVESVDNNLLYSFMVLTKKPTRQPFYSVPVKMVINFDSISEWSHSYTFKLDSLVTDKFRFIEFTPLIDTAMKGAELVLETYDLDERIDWRSIYLEPGALLSIKLQDVIPELHQNLYIKLFIWNSAKKKLDPIEVKMFQRPDNPWEYQFKKRD